MADMLATASDLASALQQDVDTSTATLLLELGTAEVQIMAGGQRIIQVVGDTVTLLGTTDAWLDLPQIPVTTVTSVTLDGTLLTVDTDYQVFGNRLHRPQGWQANYGWPWGVDGQGQPWWTYAPPSLTWPYQKPSKVVVVYTHGYASGAQELQLARTGVLSLACSAYVNPANVTSESIDDYSVSYAARVASAASAATHLKAAIRRQYGRRGGLVRVG